MNLFSKDYLYRILALTVLVFCIVAIIWIQFWTPTLYGADGYLHIRMAKFIKDYGLKYDFHWARYSTFAKNFSDKDLLYHLLLIPFTNFSNIFFGAKLSSILFAIIFFIAFFFVLRTYSIKPLIPLFLIAVLLSDRFFYLLLWPRPMIFVITLTILGIYFLIEEKLWSVFIVTIIYCLSHVSGPYMFLYALLTESTRYLNTKRFNLKSIGIVVLGIVASYLIHPNFPNNILVFYLNAILVPIYAVKWGLELGAEFFPISTREYLLSYPFLVLAIILILFIAVILRPKATLKTQVFLFHSSIYFIFSFLSQRYIAHGYPLILLSLASYVQDYFKDEAKSFLHLKNIFRSIIIFLCGSGLIFGIYTYKNLRQFAFVSKVFDSHYEVVGRFLQQNAPKGELIFHTNWSDSQYFIGVNPENDYLVTFDPMYMFYYDRKLYNLYRDVSFGRTKDPYNILKYTFKVNYGYAGKNYFGGLIEQLRKDGRFKVMAEDNLGLIFKIE